MPTYCPAKAGGMRSQAAESIHPQPQVKLKMGCLSDAGDPKVKQMNASLNTGYGLALLDTPADTVLHHHGPTIQEQFIEFDAANPDVYDALVRFAYEAKAKGFEKIGIALLWERLRWYQLVEVEGDGNEFMLSNSFRSRYARKIMANEPGLENIFRTRPLRSL
jgi:hypothetical protein